MKFLFLFLALMQNIGASPRVIKDNRISDLGVTPEIGRGYSLTNNTYHSMCFQKVKTTTPSYDLKYDFTEIDESLLRKITKTGKLEDAYLNSFLLKHARFEEEQTERRRRNKKVKIKNILIHISMDSFYHALNESGSVMDPSAANLVRKGDLIKFFEVCGFYYVKSLGRHASFMALLKYEETDDKGSDKVFKQKLRRKIYSFHHHPKTDKEFMKEVYKRKLRINVEGLGLGKGDVSDLVPTDIRELKKTVDAATKLMQDADAGLVTSMEITPWHENINFLAAQKDEDDQGRRSLFRETKNLQENSAIIAEVERVDQHQMNSYYKTYNCLRILKEEFTIGPVGEFKFDPDKTFFYNLHNRTNKSLYKSLRNLKTFINQAKIMEMQKANDLFLNGKEGTDDKGALYCLDELYEKGLKKVNYRQIKSCEKVMSYSPKSYFLVDHYCLPEMVPR